MSNLTKQYFVFVPLCVNQSDCKLSESIHNIIERLNADGFRVRTIRIGSQEFIKDIDAFSTWVVYEGWNKELPLVVEA
jgi:hypothetical protein